MKHKKRLNTFCVICIALNMAVIASFVSPILAATEKSSNNMSVAAGSSHSLLIDGEGNVWAFGNNDYKQLGDGSNISKENPVMVYSKTWKGKAISVAAGSKQSLALLEDGTVLSWGYGNSAQEPAILEKATAIAAGQEMCMAILQSGNVVCWSDKLNERTIEKDGGGYLENIEEISIGNNDFLILRDGTNGNIYQLDKIEYRIASKITVSDTSSASSSLTPTATGTPTEEPSVSISPTPTTGLTGSVYLKNVVSISAGTNFGIALTSSGDVYSWGDPKNGELGQGNIGTAVIKTAKKITALSNITKIVAGAEHAIAFNNNGNIFGWGNANDMRLDPSLTGIKKSPVQLDSLPASIAQIDSGNTYNIAMSSSSEFYKWGNGKAVEKLILKQSLLKTTTPSIVASLVGDQTMTITWNPNEFYTEMATAFVITYTMPDGTVAKTQLLPLTQTQITLRGLQAATNYKVMLSIIGKTGFEDVSPVFVVQTAKDDGISPSPEPTAEPTAVPTNTQAAGTSSGSSEAGKGTGKTSSIFGLILIIIVFLVLVAAIIAIVYVWKRLDKDEIPKIKSVRVSSETAKIDSDFDEDDQEHLVFDKDASLPAELKGRVIWNDINDESAMDDMDMKIVTPKETVDPQPPVLNEEPPVAFIYPTDGNENKIEDQTIIESDETDEQEKSLFDDNKNEENDDDEFLTRLPNTRGYDDDEDDFIIRKPGEPKK